MYVYKYIYIHILPFPSLLSSLYSQCNTHSLWAFTPWCFFTGTFSSSIHFQKVACAFAPKMPPFLVFRKNVLHVIPTSIDHSSLLFCSTQTYTWLYCFSLVSPNITLNALCIGAFSSPAPLSQHVHIPPTQSTAFKSNQWNPTHWTSRWRELNSHSKSDSHKTMYNLIQKLSMSNYPWAQGLDATKTWLLQDP